MKKKLASFFIILAGLIAYFWPHGTPRTGIGGPSPDVSSTVDTATDTYAGICLSTYNPTSTYTLVPNTSEKANGYDIVCGKSYTLHCAGTQDAKLSPKDSGLQCQ